MLAASAEGDADTVRRAVTGEGEARAARRQKTSIDLDSGDAARHPAGVLDRDLVARRVIAERDLEARPRARDAGIEMENRAA